MQGRISKAKKTTPRTKEGMDGGIAFAETLTGS
jgi:hypothetical protein